MPCYTSAQVLGTANRVASGDNPACGDNCTVHLLFTKTATNWVEYWE